MFPMSVFLKLFNTVHYEDSVYVVVNFIGNIYSSFVSTSLANVTIPKNKRKTKVTWDKKLTTTYI